MFRKAKVVLFHKQEKQQTLVAVFFGNTVIIYSFYRIY
jgi:hypothetical protein